MFLLSLGRSSHEECTADQQLTLLIMQVAQLRALAKTNPNAPIPAMSANSASQKAAALAAAALLQKKFGQTSGPGNADHAIRQRRSPSPDRYMLQPIVP